MTSSSGYSDHFGCQVGRLGLPRIEETIFFYYLFLLSNIKYKHLVSTWNTYRSLPVHTLSADYKRKPTLNDVPFMTADGNRGWQQQTSEKGAHWTARVVTAIEA
jgi:hypothetical protein